MMKKIIILFLLATLINGSFSCGSKNNTKEDSEYISIKIGNQEWMSENLNISHFRNGDIIFEANSYQEWENANIKGIPAWCYFKNDQSYEKKYGKLYNWWAVRDDRGLAPEGWHIPNEKEWLELADFLGGIDIAGAKMKSTEGWTNNGNGSNKSDFNGLPGGFRSHNSPSYIGGPFYEAGKSGYWWSTTRYLVDNAWVFKLSNDKDSLEKRSFVYTSGLSVRLIKD